MIASRLRGTLLIAASLFFVGLAVTAPLPHSILRRVAHRLGVRSGPPPAAIGRPLGHVSLSALDGSTVSLRPRNGRALLVNVFATWCLPCRAETPELARASGALAGAGIDVVGIDQAEPAERVTQFAREFGLHYPLYIDADSSTRNTLDARVIPTTLFIDARGLVRFVHAGPLDTAEFLQIADREATR